MQGQTLSDTRPRILTDAQLKSFERDGYLVLRALFSDVEVTQIRDWTEELAGYPEVPGKYMMYFEQSLTEPGKRLLSRVENFVPYHEGFAALVTGEKMLGTVSELFSEPATLFKDKINFKLPGADGFKAHQDVQAGWDSYASLHITAMVAIDRTTATNGSLELVAGEHKRGLLGHKWEPLTDADTAGMEFIAVDAMPGDAVFFDSFAPHRSGPNRSREPRRILYITYNRLSEGDHRVQYYIDKRQNYPPDCEREQGKTYEYKV
ncbi:MAG: phytanoyl-CoA dioxygenase family protein [Acidiferrobacterales bacterium]